MIKNFFKTTLFLFLISCNLAPEKNSHQDKENSFKYKLDETDNLTIPIPENSNYKSRYVCYHKDKITGKRYLLRQNEGVNGIEFIDLTTKNIELVIKFDKEGPDGIGKIRGFYFINFDSIFLTSLYRTKIYLGDSSGKIKNTFNVSESRFEYGDFYCYTDNKIIYKNNNMYISTLPALDYERNPDLYYKSFISIEIDLQNNKTTELPVTYPVEYLKKLYTSSAFGFFSRTFNPVSSDIIYSFPGAQEITVYNLLSKKISYFNGKSRYISEIKPLKNKNASFKRKRHYYLETPKYYIIEYNPFEKIYYRINLLPIETEKSKDYHPFLHIEMPFSIIVFDENFNILTEKKFPKHIYYCSDYFVDEQGLWLSNNNPFNPGFDENKLSYSLFGLKENKYSTLIP